MHILPDHTAKTELQLLVRGLVYAPGDASYESEAAAFNLATRHTPDLVLTAFDADDVVAAVRWASARNMSIPIQSTGRGAANAVSDGLLISTRYMLELSIDPDERTARVGAGVRWRDVLRAAAPNGLTGCTAPPPTSAWSATPSAAGCPSWAASTALHRTMSSPLTW
ncbi:FAD-binding oxidoreductase [Arthrobacter sp. MPF02]|uniref:FAD-binding oxidoreductase n=1 Tax=Arthrobacter sp. MPF02 TaxID=3388492 RepID=UPI0039850281